MKKVYIKPESEILGFYDDCVLLADSKFSVDYDEQEITPSDDLYGGEFTGRYSDGDWED